MFPEFFSSIRELCSNFTNTLQIVVYAVYGDYAQIAVILCK